MAGQEGAGPGERVRPHSSRAQARSPTASAINQRSPVPKYHQLTEILSDLIATELEVDTPIPSERVLAERFGVARMTVRQAVNQLVTGGKLYRVPARGTYVARPTIVLPVRLTSFTEDMASRGLVPGSVELVRRTEPAAQAMAVELGIPIGEQIHVIERLRTADGEPMAIERAHLPAAVAPGLTQDSLKDRSLYEVLEERYGIVLDAGEQTIQASTVDAADARLLAVPDGSPVLLFTRLSFAAGVPIEYVVSAYRADRYQLHVALDAQPRASSGSVRSTISQPSSPGAPRGAPPGVPPGVQPRRGVRP
jgi:GntR family transcriptional regulator